MVFAKNLGDLPCHPFGAMANCPRGYIVRAEFLQEERQW
jgi:hypothetical protein